MSEEDEEKDWLEALDRAVQEVEALQAIYDDDGGGDDESATIRLLIKNPDPIEEAKDMVIESGDDGHRSLQEEHIPTMELEMIVSSSSSNDEDATTTTAPRRRLSVQLYFGLSPGYPSYKSVKVSALTADGLMGGRSAREEMSRSLQERANDMIGIEAIMELTQECQEKLNQIQQLASSTKAKAEEPDTTTTTTDDNHQLPQQLGRRWIWVHHIKDRQRKDDIVREAQERCLGGYLKAGYPGIVVIEGPKTVCDEFVMWIKGNRSRPGGFGRQWGHHVRGELDNITHCQLPPKKFVAVAEDMSVLASLCREHNLQDEFLKFVMQHR